MYWIPVSTGEASLVLWMYLHRQPKGRTISAVKLEGGTTEEREGKLKEHVADSDEIFEANGQIYCLTCAIS